MGVVGRGAGGWGDPAPRLHDDEISLTSSRRVVESRTRRRPARPAAPHRDPDSSSHVRSGARDVRVTSQLRSRRRDCGATSESRGKLNPCLAVLRERGE